MLYLSLERLGFRRHAANARRARQRIRTSSSARIALTGRQGLRLSRPWNRAGVLVPRRPVLCLQGHASRRLGRAGLHQRPDPRRCKRGSYSWLPGASDRPRRNRFVVAERKRPRETAGPFCREPAQRRCSLRAASGTRSPPAGRRSSARGTAE
jgi:hypothetical protein